MPRMGLASWNSANLVDVTALVPWGGGLLDFIFIFSRMGLELNRIEQERSYT